MSRARHYEKKGARARHYEKKGAHAHRVTAKRLTLKVKNLAALQSELRMAFANHKLRDFCGDASSAEVSALHARLDFRGVSLSLFLLFDADD
jgi:hypothetical protein